MSKQAVRIGVVSTGIISTVLLILYLPVMIWSPPWGKHGYYMSYDYMQTKTNMSYVYFKNGHHVKNEYNKETGVFLSRVSKYTPIIGESTKWTMTNSKESRRIIVTELIIEQDISDFKVSHGAMAPTQTKTKTYNPFTLWYIKWAEWNA